MTLHVDSLGAGDDVVLLHGWGMHGGVWEGVQAELARHFRVHAVDLPGLGHSPACTPYTLVNLAERLAEAFPQPVHVCGWSLGGQIAVQWALAQPAQVRRLVLVGATPRFVSGEDWRCGVEEAVFRQFAQQVAQDYRGTLMRFLALQAHGGDAPRAQIKQLRERFFARGEPAPEVLQAGLRILLGTDLRDAVAGLQQPVLLVHGTHDMLAPVTASEWMAGQLPHARLEKIAGASHAPFLSHPTRFVSAVRDFMEQS
jgi:pimeloyl-[acyl-carrier protein] methyl ester esterase